MENLRREGHQVHEGRKSQSSQIITRTQEPDDHDHSDHNGTSVQLQEFKVVDSLSGSLVGDQRRAKYRANAKSKTRDPNGQDGFPALRCAKRPKS